MLKQTCKKQSIIVSVKAKDLGTQKEQTIVIQSNSGLTDEEIDQLMQEKWFGNFEEKMVKLVTQPLLADLQTLEMLNDRYADTLDDIDNQISQAESELDKLMQDLVVK